MITLLLFIILSMVASWMIFKKAGRHSMLALIPFHRNERELEIAGMPGWQIFLFEDETSDEKPSSLKGSLKPRPVEKAAAEATTPPESKPKAAPKPLKPRPTPKPKTVNEALADDDDRVIDTLQKSAVAEDITAPVAGAPLTTAPTKSPLFNGASEQEQQEQEPKKNKSKILIILISAVALLLLVIIGVGTYLLLNKDKGAEPTIEQTIDDEGLYTDPSSKEGDDSAVVDTTEEDEESLEGEEEIIEGDEEIIEGDEEIIEGDEEIIEGDEETIEGEEEAPEEEEIPEDEPEEIVAPVDLPSNTIQFDGAYYSGDIKNGKANGMGKMTYTKRTLISKFDLDKRYAEAGQYIIGNWYNNEIDFGKLYNSDGVIIETIIIGRAQ